MADASPDYPQDPNLQLLTGVIFAESASKFYGGGENAGEKEAIGKTFVNAAHYAATTEQDGKKCWNSSFGDGTILAAIQKLALAYNTATWNRVMNGSSLKPAAELAKLQPDDAEHLRLSVEAANTLSPLIGPKAVNALAMKNPVAFNRAGDSPPSARMEKIGHLGAHTFYGFKQGRECQ
jgi:hypothetical protein